ncbi:MAG: aldose 1-epimerase family protein [Bacteroidota bacterium]
MYQIENEFLKVKVREYGAELTSIFSKQTTTEHLWQAETQIWGWHAPVLFPVVGRCLNDEIVIEGRTYPIEKHGFARKSNFKLLELSETKIVLSLVSSAETLKFYPYKFEFLIGYRLDDNRLVCSYEVLNKDHKAIYFQLGGHPAFAVPFQNNEKYEDYFLEFERTENSFRHLINDQGYFDGRKEKGLDNSSTIPLRNDLFKDDALIFKDLKSSRVCIKSRNHSHFLSIDFPHYKYLGLWAKENAPYVCIEPWHGCADTDNDYRGFSEKEGILTLEQGGKFYSTFDVTIG